MAVDEGEIPIDRKTLYRYFADMRDIGIDIKSKRQGRGISYYIDSKFTADELVFVIEQMENGYSRSKASHFRKELLSLVSVYQEKEVLEILKANKKRRNIEKKLNEKRKSAQKAVTDNEQP